MKNLGKILFAILGYIIAGVAIYWGANRCSGKEQSLLRQLQQAELVKQHPVSTFVDTLGREHVKYNDGSVAKLPQDAAKQKLYTNLRDGMAGALNDILTTDPDVKVTEVARVTTRTTTELPKPVIDSTPTNGFTQLDKWTKVFKNESGGLRVEQDAGLNQTRHNERGGFLGLINKPYISFYSDNPNAKISGYERYSTPLPVYKPVFKIYAQADYNITTQNTSTDIGTSIRIGRFEVGGYGRLDYNIKNSISNNGLLINKGTVIPSYGARIRYNIVEQ